MKVLNNAYPYNQAKIRIKEVLYKSNLLLNVVSKQLNKIILIINSNDYIWIIQDKD